MSKRIKSPALDEAQLEDEEISVNEEGQPYPVLGGTRLVAVRWLGHPRNVVQIEARDDGEFRGKK